MHSTKKTTVQDAGRGAVFACVTHFSAFLTNFRRHFGTFIEVISTQILNSRIQLDYLYRHAKYQVCSVSKSTLNFCLKIGFKFAWPFWQRHWIRSEDRIKKKYFYSISQFSQLVEIHKEELLGLYLYLLNNLVWHFWKRERERSTAG